MIELNAETFHPVAQNVRCLACVLHRGAWAEVEAAALAIQSHLKESAPVWTRLDLDAAPEVAQSFGLTGAAEPQLLLMKERVVLHLEPLAQQGAPETAALIAEAMRVDMEAARRTIAEARSAQSHLFARRVCPTAQRGKS